jgi:hypothetical protein
MQLNSEGALPNVRECRVPRSECGIPVVCIVDIIVPVPVSLHSLSLPALGRRERIVRILRRVETRLEQVLVQSLFGPNGTGEVS